MGLLESALSIGSYALTLVKQYLSNPSITILDPTTGLPTGVVFLQALTYSESAQNTVSQMVLVNVGRGKEYVFDNIAPLPRKFTISGYLYPQVLSGAEISTIADIDAVIVEGYRQKLRDARTSRSLVLFKPAAGSAIGAIQSMATGALVTCAIESLELPLNPEITNRGLINITLVEITELYTDANSSISVASPAAGTASGPSASVGSSNPQVAT
jgi:hypothetical protein